MLRILIIKCLRFRIYFSASRVSSFELRFKYISEQDEQPGGNENNSDRCPVFFFLSHSLLFFPAKRKIVAKKRRIASFAKLPRLTREISAVGAMEKENGDKKKGRKEKKDAINSRYEN